MFGVTFNHLKEKVLHLKCYECLKTARWHKSSLLSFMVTCVSLLFINHMDISIFSVGHLVRHSDIFLSDIHKRCPIVRQVRRISTALTKCKLRTRYMFKTWFPQEQLEWGCPKATPIWLVVRRESRSSKINFQKLIFKLCRPVLVKNCAPRFANMDFRIWNDRFGSYFT